MEPDNARTYCLLGHALQAQGKLDEAIAEYRQAVKRNPGLGEAHHNLGIVLQKQGKIEQAIVAFAKVIELEPDHAVRHNNLAWLLATWPEAKVRDPKRAVELAKKAVELAPKNGICWQTLGYAEYRAGTWKSAITALEKVKELGFSCDSLEWFPLAMAHWQLGEKEAARKWYDQAVQWMEKNDPRNEELGRFRVEADKLLELKK